MKLSQIKASVETIIKQTERELIELDIASSEEYVQDAIRKLRSAAYAVLIKSARVNGMVIDELDSTQDPIEVA